MFTKLYEKIRQIIKEYYRLILLFFVLLFIFTFPLPYYINTPGGLINLSGKIKVADAYPSKGSFNLAYVTELKATIPTLILSRFNKDWDVLKKEEVVAKNETASDVSFRDHLMLEEANSNAVILAYQKAGKEVIIESTEVYVTYLDTSAKTTLEISDQLLELNNQKITSKADLQKQLQSYKVGEELTFRVKNDNKIVFKTASLIEVEGRKLIGLTINEKRKYQTDPKIQIKFSASESGPSGGLMMSLSIYNYLTPFDFTKGKTIVGTGTIDLEGNVGSIGGVVYKLKGAVKSKAKLFFVPQGENYEEAMALKEKYHYDITIVGIATFDEAIEYLKNN